LLLTTRYSTLITPMALSLLHLLKQPFMKENVAPVLSADRIDQNDVSNNLNNNESSANTKQEFDVAEIYGWIIW
jgi:hypothetical protein